MQNDDRARSEILDHEPSYVPNRWMRWIVRIRGAQHRRVASRPGESKLPRPRKAAGRTKQLSLAGNADRLLCSIEVSQECRVAVE